MDFRVRTRSQDLKQKKVKLQDFKRCCRARGREGVRVIYLKKNNYVVK